MRNAMVQIGIVVMMLAVSSAPAHAAPGDLDPTFGTNGWALFGDDDPPEEHVTSMAVQPDGAIVVAGSMADRFAVWRILADGTPDTTFGSYGSLLVTFAARESEALDVLLMPDGRIVAVGFAGRRVAAVRLLADGALDTSFGEGDGIVTLRLAEKIRAAAEEAEVLPDSGLVLAGPQVRLPDYGRESSFLLRLTAEGLLDETFGSGGMVLDPRSFAALAVEDEGIVVALWPRWNRYRFVVARYELSGTHDVTFGGDGYRRYCLYEDRCEGYDSYPADLVIDASGNLVLSLGGWFPYRNRIDSFAVMRLTSDGDRDASFSGDGLRTFLSPALGSYPSALAIQDDGRILMSGYIYGGGGSGEYWPVLARVLPDGQIDTSFGGRGYVFAPPEEYFWTSAVDLGLQSANGIVILAEISYRPGFGLARFLGT